MSIALDKKAILDGLDKKIRELELQRARDDLLAFAERAFPVYSVGPHPKVLAKLFRDIVHGKNKRIIVNIAPRHGKSLLTSFLFPAWYVGHHPDRQIIMATHTASLSEDFGRQVRNLVNSAEYAEIFPGVELSQDSKSAGSWTTNKGGRYYAVGVGGALAGRGADLLVIDDPHSEQDLKTGTKLAFEQAWSWYQTGPRQRLMWGGNVVVVMTRWSALDLTAKLVDYQTRNPGADQWEVVEFPAILPSGKSLWPAKWPVDELLKTKATLLPRYWNAQYQQNPTADEIAIIKRDMWRVWEEDEPPDCEFVIQSWDTAFETKNSSDFSACTTWGVWYNEEEHNKANIILLDAFKDRMEFPELKEKALELYKEWKPESLIIEKKVAGAPLIQELRRMDIPVQEFTPSRGNDKMVRLNAVAPLFAGGVVWAPARGWAHEVIEEVAAFPAGEHDDFVDTVTCSMLRFRQGNFIRLDSDWKEEPQLFRSARSAAYY